jgi:hypothetical protein
MGWGDDMLGAMAQQMESEIWGRLQAHYREMSDEELLQMAAAPGELTDVAQQVLRGEMASRSLRLESGAGSTETRRWASDAFEGTSRISGTTVPKAIVGAGPELDSPETESSGAGPGEVSLRTFHDAFEVGRACESLEGNGVPFRLEDVSEEMARTRGDGYAAVALNLIVEKSNRERAVAVLRKEMGLFPVQEVAEPDAMIDDGTVSQVGYFGGREDADEIARVLEEAGIWHRVVANPDGAAETEDAWVVEVREVDLMRAGDVVEKALG